MKAKPESTKCRACGSIEVMFCNFGSFLCSPCAGNYERFAMGSQTFEALLWKYMEDQIFRRWLEARRDTMRDERRKRDQDEAREPGQDG